MITGAGAGHIKRKRPGSERFGELLFYGVVILVGYLAYQVASPFLGPLAWASILALTLYPLHRRLEARFGPSKAALASTLAAAVLIVGPVATIVSMVAGELPQVVDFAQRLPKETTPERIKLIWDNLTSRVPFGLPDDPTQLIRQGAQSVASFVAPRVGGAVANIFGMLGSLFVMLFALFFLLRDNENVVDLLRRVLPFPDAERERLLRETHDLVIASVGAGLAVAAVQGAIGGVTFWALGLGAPAAWGVAIGICSLIPVVGAALVWVPVALWWALSGAFVKALILTGVGAAVIGMVDNILRPLLLSGRASVNGLVVFIGLLGGGAAFGFVGLVVGPIVLVTAGTLVDALTRRSNRVVAADEVVPD
jgi:predicted PurR-regulated permease PerM